MARQTPPSEPGDGVGPQWSAEGRTSKRRGMLSRPSKAVGSFAMIQPHRVRIKATTSKMDVAEGGERSKMGSWQATAFGFHESIGELGFIDNLTANQVALCTLRPLMKEADGNEAASTDPRVIRVLNAFTGPRGGQAELMRRAALHLCICGESLLLGQPTVDEDTGENLGIWWEFLSPLELLIEEVGGKGRLPKVVRKADGIDKHPVGPNVYIARMWRSDPEWSHRADSPLKRVLNIAAEIVTLTQVVDAIARSRLNAGLLYVPDEMSFGPDDETEDDIDNLSETLLQHMSAPVADRSSAASLVPLVVRGPAELAAALRLIDLSRSLDTWAKDLREEALVRLARGLDAPPEMMLGKNSLSHWTSFNVDSSFATKNCVPVAELIADFVTHAYFRPMLEEFEGMSAVEAAAFRLDVDAGAITARSDEAASAQALHDQDLVSDVAAIRANGFSESDMPDPEELLRRTALRLILVAPAIFAPELLKFVPGFEGIKITVPVGAGGTTGVDPANAPTTKPAGSEPAPRQPDAASTEGMVLRLATAADAALDRALERAAQRVVNRAGRGYVTGGTKSPDTAKAAVCDRIQGDKVKALALISPSDLLLLGETPDTLLAGAWERLGLNARGWVRDWLEADAGLAPKVADEKAYQVASCLVLAMDEYARINLHRQIPAGPNGLRVPDALVQAAIAVAG